MARANKKYSSNKELISIRHQQTLDRKPSGSKMIKRAKAHKLDHSNPGGVVSEWFRQKNGKI